MSFGRGFDVIEPERGLQQYTRILESLAMARTWGDVSLGDMLSNEARRFGRHTTRRRRHAVDGRRWVASMAMLQSRGVKVAAIVLEPSTFGGDESSLGVFASLAAADVFSYMVKHADDLQSALGAELMLGVAREVRQLAMREANWDEIFQRRNYDDPALADQRLSSVVPWEDWLTFALATIAFMSVAAVGR